MGPKTILKYHKTVTVNLSARRAAEGSCISIPKDSDVKDFIDKIEKGEIDEIKVEARPSEILRRPRSCGPW